MPVLERAERLRQPNKRIFLVQFGDRPYYTSEARDCWLTPDERRHSPAARGRHHQLPWAALRAILNHALVEELQTSGSDKLLSLVKRCSYQGAHAGPHDAAYQSAVKTLDQRLRSASPAQTTLDSILSRPEQDALEDFAAHFCWLPGNIFLGPVHRIDDPNLNPDRKPFEHPPTHRETALTGLWSRLYSSLAASDWPAATADLEAIAREKPWHKSTLIPYRAGDWREIAIDGNPYFRKS